MSTFDETENVFIDVLGFEAMPNLRKDEFRPGYHEASNGWLIQEQTRTQTGEVFSLGIWFDTTTRILEGVQFLGSPAYLFGSYASPVGVLRDFGEPTHLLISRMALSEDPSEGNILLDLIYQSGFDFSYGIHVYIANNGVGVGGRAQICLGESSGLFGPNTTALFLTRPINDLSRLSSFQEDLFGGTLKNWDYQTFESVFGLTGAEVTEMAQRQSNPCFYTDVP